MFHTRSIINILGSLLIIEGFFILLCLPVSLLYRENDSSGILISGLITGLTGFTAWFVTRKTPRNISTRDSYVIVTSGWVFFSLFGALPFFISGAIPSFTDAFFETASGFTTTGASILQDVESISHGMHFWRSLTQWIGGMGFIVLSLAILPLLGIGGMQLFIAEVPGPAPDKLHPRIADTAKRLWLIYVIFTLSEAILLWLGDMSLFDSLCHSFTTMATGGYSTKQASIAYWDSPYIHYVITFFMFIAGTNFTLSYFALHLRFNKLYKNEEFRYYLGFVIGFTILIALIMIFTMKKPLESSFRHSLFQVVSIMTTTGFVTSDYMLWTPILWVIIVFLMFFGASAGSTCGSIKLMRIILLIKNSALEMKRLIHPNAIIPVRFNGVTIHPDITTNVLAFVSFYLIIVVISIAIISAFGYELDTSLGAVASTLGNIGPGIGLVGPAYSFDHFPVIAKWFLSMLMIIGRLELFTVLLLFTPGFWKR